MDVDRPPDFWTLVMIGAGVFVLLLCCCCTSAPLIWMYREGGLKNLKR